MAQVHRYAELRPKQLAARLEAYPVAVAPWGALEWHGPHLPFGLDGLVADSFAEQVAARTGAVLLPVSYLPVTALPHPHSIGFPAEPVRLAVERLLESLAAAGFRLACLVSGHYAHGHELVFAELAEAVTRRGELMVLAATPLALLDDPELLDHAGLWETSQLLAYRPELVELQAIPDGPLPPTGEIAVLGQDPRRATAERGRQVLDRALDAWAGWIERLLGGRGPAPLYALYGERRAAYQSYVDQYYRGSWEEALQAWWDERAG